MLGMLGKTGSTLKNLSNLSQKNVPLSSVLMKGGKEFFFIIFFIIQLNDSYVYIYFIDGC